ncbi:cytochrome P450 [Streptomyces albus]|uniref:cytochrome P450 n=1 Tax=Streptomyces albus TaxID=1888 RepID=UPI0024AD6C1E|nr:cytochrome P450 [Streptomyces albus]MDI6412511.1 cytochrome P450 [Streptomyces albus]
MSEDFPRFPFSFRGDRLAPELAEMAAHRPVRRVITNTGTPAWLVAGHEEATAVLRDRRFSLSLTSDPTTPRQDDLLPPPPVTDTLNYFQRAGMLSELHRGLGPDQQYLTAGTVAGITRQVLGPFLAGEQPGDLVSGFIVPVSRALTFRLLGLTDDPRLDHEVLLGIFRTGPNCLEHVPECWQTGRDYIYGQLPRLRREKTGMLGRMVGMADASGVLTEEELADLFLFLVISQYGNPATFLGAATVALMRHPDITRRLRAEPEMMPQAVEELLRWTAFLGDGLPRIAREDVTVGGVLVRRGELVLVSTDGANHDPRVFPDPQRIDIDRRDNPHLRFSHGRHRCPGRTLAPMQAAATLRTLLEETGELSLAVSPDDIEWHPYHAITMPRALPVRWRTAESSPAAGAAG